MKTEQEIVYGFLEDMKANQINNDEVISERYIRAILNEARGKELRVYYHNGIDVSDEVFQNKVLRFESTTKVNRIEQTSETGKPDPRPIDYVHKYGQPLNEYSSVLPKLIRLNDYGFNLNFYGISIPIVPDFEYNSVKHDKFEKNLIIGTTDYKIIKIRVPSESECLTMGENKELLNYILNPMNGTGFKRKFDLSIRGVFVNPEDADDYDWENDPYPFPPERLDDFLTNIVRRKLGISQASKSDEVQNNREDSIRYHDNTSVNNAS